VTLAVVLFMGVGALVVCVVLGRYRHQDTVKRWEMLLTPEGERNVDLLAHQAEADGWMVRDSFSAATEALERTEYDEARRLLALSYECVSEATPDRIRRLKAMAVCCRMAAALIPPTPPGPAPYRLREVRTLEAAAAVAHHVLVSPTERFVLRCRVLAAGFGLTVRALARAVPAASALQPAGWRSFENGVADWQTLDGEHVRAFRALIASVSASER
jgi:hypothetical protein